jgi:ABC-type polar amino acid transport system ATPase subunit
MTLWPSADYARPIIRVRLMRAEVGLPASLAFRQLRERGLTLVLVTHDSSIARRARRVAPMQNGKLSIRQDTRRTAT